MLFLLAVYLCKRLNQKINLNTLFQRIQKPQLTAILQSAKTNL